MAKLSMSELVALHNDLADKLGVAQETSFKSSAAARAAIATLETKLEKTMNADTQDTTVVETINSIELVDAPDATPADNSKYNSSGKRGPNQGVGAFAKAKITEGLNNADVLAAVKEQFPDAKTTIACVAYYRNAIAKGPAAKNPATLRAKAAELIAEAEALEAAASEPAQEVAETAETVTE